MILRKLSFFILTFFLLLTSACLRYTPARSSISSSSDTQIAKLSGDEAFLKFEREQEERLKSIVAERTTHVGSQAQSNYRIGPGDLLEFNVFDVEEFNDTTVRVRPSGFVSLPLVGSIKVSGLTEASVKGKIEKRLSRFIHAPQVNVFIAEYVANDVSVIGAVNKPGTYHLRHDNNSLMNILSEAGGRTEKASGRVLLVPSLKSNNESDPVDNASQEATQPGARAQMKGPNAESHGIEVYFDDLAGNANTPPIVIPLVAGDTIVVPEAGTVEVDGEVEKPGSYPLSSRMTLLSAIAAAGGFTYSSKVAEVEVIREIEPGKKVALTIDAERLAIGEEKDVRLRDGDVIRVPSHSGRFAVRQLFEGINRLFSFGVSASPI